MHYCTIDRLFVRISICGTHQAREEEQGAAVVSWPETILRLQCGVEPQGPLQCHPHRLLRDLLSVLHFHLRQQFQFLLPGKL